LFKIQGFLGGCAV